MPSLENLLVTIVSRAGDAGGVQGLPGNEPWKVVGGTSQFSATARPKRVDVTDFETVSGRQLSGQIMFDRYREDGSVEDRVRALKAIGRPLYEGQDPFPALVMGNAIPAEARSSFWFLTGVEEQDGTLKNSKGQVTRVLYSLTFVEQPREDAIAVKETAPKVDCSKAKAPKGKKHLKLRKGQTVQDVAAKYLKSRDCWKRIKVIRHGKAVTIRDPKTVKPGDDLRLP